MIQSRLLLAGLTLLCVAQPATFAQSTPFTYQGRLDAGGQPANGLYSLKFTLHNAAAGGGSLVGTPLTNAPVEVSNGLFTVVLDFGLSPFDGADRWLELGVRTNGVNTGHTVLAPRQAVTATPYSLRATTAGLAATVTAGGVGTGQLVNGAVTSAKLAANAVNSAIIADGTVGLADLGPDVGVWTKSGANLSYSGGNVGISTTSPSALLSLGTTVPTDAVKLALYDGADDVYGLGIVGGAMTFHVGNTEKVRFTKSGRVGIGTAAPATTLDVAGEITSVAINLTSDRNAKEQFKPVNAREVLDKVVGLPISEWQYKAQGDSRHIGPMAQDFRAAFALGRDEKHIASVDADGVALAAIQGLNEKLEERLRSKQEELDRFKDEHRSVMSRLEAIERMLQERRSNAAAE